VRPHEAVGMKTPATLWIKSDTEMKQKPRRPQPWKCLRDRRMYAILRPVCRYATCRTAWKSVAPLSGRRVKAGFVWRDASWVRLPNSLCENYTSPTIVHFRGPLVGYEPRPRRSSPKCGKGWSWTLTHSGRALAVFNFADLRRGRLCQQSETACKSTIAHHRRQHHGPAASPTPSFPPSRLHHRTRRRLRLPASTVRLDPQSRDEGGPPRQSRSRRSRRRPRPQHHPPDRRRSYPRRPLIIESVPEELK